MEQRVLNLEQEVRALRDLSIAHSHQLETGQRSFQGMRESKSQQDERVAKIEQAITPRKPNYLAIIGLVFTVATGLSASLWALSILFSSRPTLDQVSEMFEAHAKVPHPAVQNELNELAKQQNALEKVQIQQAATMDGIVKQQDSMDKKLDQLLKRSSRRSPSRASP